MEVIPQDWNALDSWWESAVEPDKQALLTKPGIVVNPGWLDDQSLILDHWWDSTVDSEQSVLVDDTAIIDGGSVNERWSELEPWWEIYRIAQKEDVAELQAELDAADEAWANSPGRFDTDPLSIDWRTAYGSTGPIRFSREEDWSYGLAHLLRSGGGKLIDEMFEEGTIGHPVSVETEAHLPGGDETTRYEDIIVTGPKGGISIEVKIGDTNLKKTVDTAALVEKHYYGDWTHVLLLPEYQLPDLRETFGNNLSEPDSKPPVIAADQSNDINVHYWREISTALRTLLQPESDLSAHWGASAYVFCTLIEQRILGLVPQPSVERMSESADVVHDGSSLSVDIGDIQSQIEYLQAANSDERR